MCTKNRDVRKIYQTTDGYFNDRLDIKKTRKVAVIHQRDDKAVVVVKLYSKKNKVGNAYIENLVLYPEKHKSLSEETLIGNSLIYGKSVNGKKHKIDPNDFTYTEDKLTHTEYHKIRCKVNADTRQHKKTRNKTIKRWKSHFKK